MMTILVTGGAGFIGSHLCEKLLAKGQRVICLDNFNAYYDPMIKRQNIADILEHRQFILIEGDIRNPVDLDSCFTHGKVDLVVHLAAMAGVRPSIEQPELYNEVNVLGNMQVLQACRRHRVSKYVFASSSSLYGNREGGAFRESDPVDNPVSPYAATKKACELMNYTYHHLYGMSVINLRFFTVYGPRQRPDLAIHKFTGQIYQKQPIAVYGDGSSSRDYTYIDDIIDGVIRAMDYVSEHQCYEICNLGEAKTVTLLQMIQTIEKVSGKTAILDYQPMQPGDVRYTCADITHSKALLGYQPSFDFEAGIDRFIRWFELRNP